jgi:hypothetical protein
VAGGFGKGGGDGWGVEEFSELLGVFHETV